jgi:hypothetical protein
MHDRGFSCTYQLAFVAVNSTEKRHERIMAFGIPVEKFGGQPSYSASLGICSTLSGVGVQENLGWAMMMIPWKTSRDTPFLTVYGQVDKN